MHRKEDAEMTQFGAFEMLKSLMAHYPKDYFPGMAEDLRDKLRASFEEHFQDYEDEDVLKVLEDWIGQRKTAPSIPDLIRAVRAKAIPKEAWSYIMTEDEVKVLRQICEYGFTDESGTYYKGPGIPCAYVDYTISMSRDRIPMPFPRFLNAIKYQIQIGGL